MTRTPLRPIPIALAAAVALGASPGAWAQALTSKDAWEALDSFVSGAGGQLRTDGLVREGDVLIARGAVLRSGDEPASFALNLGDVRIQPAAAGFDIIPQGTFEMVLRSDAMSEERRYQIAHDGRFTLQQTAAELALGFGFGALDLTQTSATRRGLPLDERLTFGFAGFAGRAGLTLAEPFDLQAQMSADRMSYTFRVNDTEIMPIRQTGRFDSERVSLTLSAQGLALMDGSTGPGSVRRAFEGGFGLTADYRSGPTTGEVDQTVGSQRIAMSLAGGDSSLVLSASGGVLTIETGADGYTVDVRSDAASGPIRLGRLDLALRAPVVVTPAEETFGFRLNLADLSVGDGLLAPLGASSFAGDTATLSLDLSALGRWLIEITENPDEAAVPFDFSTITLSNLLARIGQSSLTGSGAFTFTPGSFMRSSAPDGSGDFVFELVGGEALLNRLGAAGLLPPDQQFLARMMMNGLGRPVGADHLRSEVAIRPGNQITVNGAPLPF